MGFTKSKALADKKKKWDVQVIIFCSRKLHTGNQHFCSSKYN